MIHGFKDFVLFGVNGQHQDFHRRKLFAEQFDAVLSEHPRQMNVEQQDIRNRF